MSDIRSYIQKNLLDPLKYYPTAIQNTLLEIISDRLEELYQYTLLFPEIVAPTDSRLDILKVIANQFLFSIRDEAKLQEQIDILTNILNVYNKRGSIDTIENMWKYYGGDLPKEVQVIIPSYNLFRYSISELSSKHVFQDSTTNRTGIYEIKLSNSTYSIPELKKFLLKELVAAGNFIYFSNSINVDVTDNSSTDPFIYDINEDLFLNFQLQVEQSHSGMLVSGLLPPSGKYNEVRYRYHSLTKEQRESEEYAELVQQYKLLGDRPSQSKWSGKENLFVDITQIYSLEFDFNYIVDSEGFFTELYPIIPKIDMTHHISHDVYLSSFHTLYCTPEYNQVLIASDLYNDKGDLVKPRKYFILGESLLGENLGLEILQENEMKFVQGKTVLHKHTRESLVMLRQGREQIECRTSDLRAIWFYPEELEDIQEEVLEAKQSRFL